MATKSITQHRADTAHMEIGFLVGKHLNRWAAEVDRLKAANAVLVEALEAAREELDRLHAEHGTSWAWATRIEILIDSALKTAKETE